MSVKERIRELCAASGTSLPKLEAALGFGNCTISKWDSVSPTLAKLEAVADFFGISVSELLGEQNEKPVPEGDELTQAVIEKLMKMNSEELVRASAFIDGMLANRK